MSTTEITDLSRAIGQLRQCIGTLQGHYGDAAAVQRIANDLERLEIDAKDLSKVLPKQRGSDLRDSDIVMVPDTPYDPALWQEADDEGIGGYRRHQQ